MSNSIWMAIVGVVVLSILYKVIRTKQQHAAAMNVIFAKYTFEKLSEEKRNLVREVAKDLVLSSTSKRRGYVNEVERFGWFALAMNELGIASMVPENPLWNKVKNPYTAIKPGNKLFSAICGVLKSEYGIDIEISRSMNTLSKAAQEKSTEPSA
ncbi:MAG: hypothetical protein OEW58_11340 [Gammaproteobacteria bacterium]|nr:hypothetical protein [Gammaproteobacteria bacterium]